MNTFATPPLQSSKWPYSFGCGPLDVMLHSDGLRSDLTLWRHQYFRAGLSCTRSNPSLEGTRLLRSKLEWLSYGQSLIWVPPCRPRQYPVPVQSWCTDAGYSLRHSTLMDMSKRACGWVGLTFHHPQPGVAFECSTWLSQKIYYMLTKLVDTNFIIRQLQSHTAFTKTRCCKLSGVTETTSPPPQMKNNRSNISYFISLIIV